MQRSVATSSIECARLFDTLSKTINENSHSSLQYAIVEDQYARFRIWAGNLGAFQRLPSTASLDYRLRNSPGIVDHVETLLQDLFNTLQDILAIALGKRANRRDGMGVTETDELFQMVKSTISSLFRIAVIIRKASPRDRFARALASTETPFDPNPYIQHVGEKFPLLATEDKTWMRERLGKAIAQRRQYLSYERNHRLKLGEEPPELGQPVPFFNTHGIETATQTIASTLNISDIPFIEPDAEEDRSVVSSTLSLLEDQDESHLRPPSLSSVSKGEATFECTICWKMQSFDRESSWQKHVYSDLRAYVCTSSECDLKLFTDQREWFNHELEHRIQWHCLLCDKSNLNSLSQFRSHIRTHSSNVTDDQLDVLSKAAQRPVDRFRASDCPFCSTWHTKLREVNLAQDVPTVTPSQFMKHVGSHMRQLALFAIPRSAVEEEEDIDTLGSGTGTQSSTTIGDATPIVDNDDQTGGGQVRMIDSTASHSMDTLSLSKNDSYTFLGPTPHSADALPPTRSDDQDKEQHNNTADQDIDLDWTEIESETGAPAPVVTGNTSNQGTHWTPGSFVFRIDEIGEHPNGAFFVDNLGHWIPSTDAGAHVRVGGGASGIWWLNDRVSIRPCPNNHLPQGCQVYSAMSVYYSRGYGFWVLRGDATNPPSGEIWKPLCFEHDAQDFSSYLTNMGSNKTLRCQRPDQTWPAMLLPDIYQMPPFPTSTAYGGLKGDLALFLALIAFSMDKDRLQQYLPWMFAESAWRVHGLPHGRFDRRGVVVYVYTIPGTTSVAEIQSYESGKFGNFYH